MIGEFMMYLPITLLITLAASLVMALLFVPTIGALLGNEKTASRRGAMPDGGLVDVDTQVDLGKLTGATGAVRRLPCAAALAIRRSRRAASPCSPWCMPPTRRTAAASSSSRTVEPNQATVNIHARGDLSVHERDDLVQQVEASLVGMPEVEIACTRAAVSRLGDDGEEDVIGRIRLRFIPWSERRPAREILADVRERTEDLAGHRRRAAGSGESASRRASRFSSSCRPASPPRCWTTRSRDCAPASTAIGRHRRRHGQPADRRASIGAWRWTARRPRVSARTSPASATRFSSSPTASGLATTGPNDADDEVDIRVRFPDCGSQPEPARSLARQLRCRRGAGQQLLDAHARRRASATRAHRRRARAQDQRRT